MSEKKILDAHVHISLYEGNATTLAGAFARLLTDMRANGVQSAIVIPDNLEHKSDIADLAQARELIRGHDNLYLLGSPQIVQRGSSEVATYGKLLDDGVIRGIKFFPGHDPYYPTDERCVPYYELAVAHDVPVVFHTGINPGHEEVAEFNDPKYIVQIARKYPTLKTVITHYFWPRMQYCYELTRDVPNMYFELAGVGDPEVVVASGGMERVQEIVRKTVADRPRQVMYGTDWPMCRMEDHIAFVNSLGLSEDVTNDVFFDNAVRVYKLPLA